MQIVYMFIGFFHSKKVLIFYAEYFYLWYNIYIRDNRGGIA